MEELEAIIREYSPLVMNLAQSRVNPSDAEDVYQEVFCRYIDKQPHFKDEQHAAAWFIKVTVNITKNLYKAGEFVNRTDMSDETMAEILSDEDFIAEAEQRLDFEEGLKQIGEKDRAILMLYFDYGYTAKEIAKMYGVSEQAMKKALERAKRAYRNTNIVGGGMK